MNSTEQGPNTAYSHAMQELGAGHIPSAIASLSVVIGSPKTPQALLASALYHRGAAKMQTADRAGALADLTRSAELCHAMGDEPLAMRPLALIHELQRASEPTPRPVPLTDRALR